MNGRALSLDALRGYAIITMVLSATIVWGVLPGWMHHAQQPPPDHIFNPSLPGLTWVDLVFPAFLFAMGAAFPFSIGKKFKKGTSCWKLSLNALWRGALLTFFAIFIQHFYPFMTGGDMRSWLLAIFCFALLFPIYMRIPGNISGWMRTAIQIGAMIAGVTVMLSMNYPNGYVFNLHTSNIIILILANMAIFGSILYIYTINKPVLRLTIITFLLGVFISATVPSSWAESVMNYSPLNWFYNATYLKYLIIVIAGSFAGEILVKWIDKHKNATKFNTSKAQAWAILTISTAVVVTNLYCLYMRFLGINMIITVLLLSLGFVILRQHKDYGSLWHNLFTAGAFMLMLGLLFEPYEGGIKKDPVTLSYLFTTSGLSFMILIFFSIVCDYFKCHKGTRFLVMSGQNPMVAYVAVDLLILPIFQIIGLWQYFPVFANSQLLALLQGIILTSIAVLITMFFTKIKWMWRT